ncbi:MAG: hypothetical protein IT434_16495 [Phycisphaerales bacterium]|jgi:hypothetical protein|nr:hypothetical protein [Phycisphaerales bacterium]
MNSAALRVVWLIPWYVALAAAGCAPHKAAPESRVESASSVEGAGPSVSIARASAETAWTLAPVRSGGFSIALQRIEVRRVISFASAPNRPEGWSLQSSLSIGEPSAGLLFRPRGYVRLVRLQGDDGRDYLPAPVPAGLNPARVYELTFKPSGDASGGLLNDQRDWHHNVDCFVRTPGLPRMLRSFTGELVIDVVEVISWRELSLEVGHATEVEPGLTFELPRQPEGRAHRVQLAVRLRREAPASAEISGPPLLPFVNAVEEWRDGRWRALQIGMLNPSADQSELGTIINISPINGSQRFRAQIVTRTREVRLPFEFVNVPILANEPAP